MHITGMVDRFREPRENDRVEFDISTNRVALAPLMSG
jgi:hypothetical protein